jgi:hypothetical protein
MKSLIDKNKINKTDYESASRCRSYVCVSISLSAVTIFLDLQINSQFYTLDNGIIGDQNQCQ